MDLDEEQPRFRQIQQIHTRVGRGGWIDVFRVFVDGKEELYEELKPSAMS